MKYRFLAAIIPAVISASYTVAQDAPRPLLDETLSNWEVFTGVPHHTVAMLGLPASESTDGTTGTPVGVGDPLGIFKVTMADGVPVLHVSGQVYAGLATRESFENFHFRCQFKWGEKKWEPRLNDKRDSGILYHCTGDNGAFWNVWMRSLEMQVQESDCGDFIGLAGATADLRALAAPEGKNPRHDREGTLYSGIGYAAHGPSKEEPHGEWNTLEIYSFGSTSVHVVNGTPNMVLFNARLEQDVENGPATLTSGKIQIQSEAAEVFYKDITISPISEFPEFLRELTVQPTEPAVPYQPLEEAESILVHP